MNVHLCDKRRAILAQKGHILVLGGPGSGKTTIALLKAQLRAQEIEPGQEILFLSFSRAAVHQILARCKAILTKDERRLIQVKTYHSFCLEVLESYGRMLGGKPLRFLFPEEERIRKSTFSGDWKAEQQRLAAEESLYCFDLFADGVAKLFENHSLLRELVGDKYPLIIIDEFQDTDDDQWRFIYALTPNTTVFCLADPEQRIFEYRQNVDPQRLDTLRRLIGPTEFDLGGENHRSASSTGILQVADAVLHNKPPLPKTGDVKHASYFPNNFDSTAHVAVAWMFNALRTKGIKDPCIAVLCRSNPLVAKLSTILSEEHIYDKRKLPPIDHTVAWDASLTAAAATVVGSILEWPGKPRNTAIATTLNSVSQYYLLKTAEHPSKAATENASKFTKAATLVASGKPPRNKVALGLIKLFDEGLPLIGDPVEDWKQARRPLQEIEALNELFREVRLVRLFRATDALASGLADLWLATGTYNGAADLVRHVLNRERLIAAESAPEGCVLMTIHKSKGKEFDGVVLIEGAFSSPFLDDREKPAFEQSRRLLRVGITRARTLAMLVRPHGASSLVS